MSVKHARSAVACVMSNESVVGFPAPVSEEQQARRVLTEARRLAKQSSLERNFWIPQSAEKLGVPLATLQKMVEGAVREAEKCARKKETEDRRREQRVERQRAAAQREEKRQHEREQARINRETERKAKDKAKTFAVLSKLPGDHKSKLAELAKRIGDDVAPLREAFSEFCSVESTASPPAHWYVEPWLEPVTLAELLPELSAKIRNHVVAKPHEVLVIALWVMMAWAHEVAATYSAYLVVTSAEPDSGKSTLLGALGFLVPKPFTGAEPTGPSIYRVVDREKPTLIIDEADDLFARKTEVKHIFNAAWTRGTKIPRQVQGVTVWFDPFCPKVVGLLGMNLPRPLVGRSIVIKLWPKKADEKVESFTHADDDEFATLRRKLARWSSDNTAALKGAAPLLPANFNNRLAANWRLLLAIAELAGGTWSKQAREAAERLSRTMRKPSLGLQLLAAFRIMFACHKEVISEDVVAELNADPLGPWVEYNRGGPITQRQVAHLLEQYEIHPVPVHPTKRATLTRRGYKAVQFADAFAAFPAAGSAHPLTRRKQEDVSG